VFDYEEMLLDDAVEKKQCATLSARNYKTRASVVVKPNLVSAAAPGGDTTLPAVVSAVCRALKRMGAEKLRGRQPRRTINRWPCEAFTAAASTTNCRSGCAQSFRRFQPPLEALNGQRCRCLNHQPYS
jgi:hypothetical protein